MCTRRVTPASIAATIAGLLTACTFTWMPTFFASSTIALITSISACGGARLRRERDLAGVLDALRRQRLNRGARFGRRLPEVHLAGGDDARADELALVDAVAQRDVLLRPVRRRRGRWCSRPRAATCLLGRVSTLLTCLWPSMKPGIALMPLASMMRSPCVGAAPAVTETILPPRTMIVPESITWPLPTMIRALVIATSCADAMAGRIMKTAMARESILFIAWG